MSQHSKIHRGEKHEDVHESSLMTDQLNLKSMNTAKLSLRVTSISSFYWYESTDDLEPIYLPVSVPLFVRQQIIQLLFVKHLDQSV